MANNPKTLFDELWEIVDFLRINNQVARADELVEFIDKLQQFKIKFGSFKRVFGEHYRNEPDGLHDVEACRDNMDFVFQGLFLGFK